jgi:hypothetical protein
MQSKTSLNELELEIEKRILNKTIIEYINNIQSLFVLATIWYSFVVFITIYNNQFTATTFFSTFFYLIMIYKYFTIPTYDEPKE